VSEETTILIGSAIASGVILASAAIRVWIDHSKGGRDPIWIPPIDPGPPGPRGPDGHRGADGHRGPDGRTWGGEQ